MARLDLKSPEGLLRLGFGLLPIAAGADKFTNLLTDWKRYLDPQIAKALSVKPSTFMKVVGVIELGAGILVLTRFRRQAAYVVSAWLAAICGNLLIQGKYLDVAARDALLSLSAFAFARLEEERRPAETLNGRRARGLSTEKHPEGLQKSALRSEPMMH